MSPDPVGAGYRIWKIVDRGPVSFLYPISYLLSSAAEAALADGVRVGRGFTRIFSSLRKSEKCIE